MDTAKDELQYLKEIIASINNLMDDQVKAIDFSYDFPDLLMESAKVIDEFNHDLFVIIHEELPEICYWYEDDVEYDPNSDVLDLPHLKVKVNEQRELILNYMKDHGIVI